MLKCQTCEGYPGCFAAYDRSGNTRDRASPSSGSFAGSQQVLRCAGMISFATDAGHHLKDAGIVPSAAACCPGRVVCPICHQLGNTATTPPGLIPAGPRPSIHMTVNSDSWLKLPACWLPAWRLAPDATQARSDYTVTAVWLAGSVRDFRRHTVPQQTSVRALIMPAHARTVEAAACNRRRTWCYPAGHLPGS